MRKIIDRKVYDTDTATLIGSDESSLGQSDFRYYDESLYITKNRRFFLAGEGHAMSRWGKSNRNTTAYGDGIIPMTEDEALEWCEDSDIDADIIEKYFTVENG